MWNLGREAAQNEENGQRKEVEQLARFPSKNTELLKLVRSNSRNSWPFEIHSWLTPVVAEAADEDVGGPRSSVHRQDCLCYSLPSEWHASWKLPLPCVFCAFCRSHLLVLQPSCA